MVCVLLSYSSHVMSPDCDLGLCDFVTLSHVILSCTPSLCSKFRKEKKRNINNALAVLLSHDTMYYFPIFII